MEINKNKNYYKTLGFGISDELGSWKMKDTPTDKEIKVSYRNLSKQHHPDVSKEDNAHEIFEHIVEAYKILSGDKRDKYDRLSRFGVKYDNSLEIYDFEFSNESDSISSVKAKAKSYAKSNVCDILMELDSIVDEVTVERYVTCSYCDGNGFDPNEDALDCDMCETTGDYNGHPCTMCNGVGSLSYSKCKKCDGDKLNRIEEIIDIKEEKFTDNQLIIKLKGNNDKFKIGKVGDLYIKLKE